MDNFITIRRRDDTAVPLLAPNQDIYLRENIRSRLLVAAQAVPRHQQETYRQALENVPPGYVLTTILMMPPPKRSSTRWTVKPAKYLDGFPETLQSQAMLEKLMQTRVRNLLAQPAAGTTEAKPAPAPAPAPAPQADTSAAAPQGE